MTSPVCVTFKNPCVDPDYVYFVAPELMDEKYAVGSGPMDFDPPHADFMIVSKNPDFDPAQCGDVKVTAYYDGTPVNGNVLSYNSNTNTFTINTNDDSLVGQTKRYALEAEFVDYPADSTGASKEYVEADILFQNACMNPMNF